MSSCCCLKTCGDAELSSCFVVATISIAFLWLLLSAFPWVFWALTGCWRAQKCRKQGLEHLSLLQLPAGASSWLLLPDRRLWVSTMCCALSQGCLCTGSAGGEPTSGSGWKGAVVSFLGLQTSISDVFSFLTAMSQWMPKEALSHLQPFLPLSSVYILSVVFWVPVKALPPPLPFRAVKTFLLLKP